MVDGAARRWTFRIAVVLLAGGSAIYWGFRFTHAMPLVMAGLAWLGVGLLALPVGLWLAATSVRPRTLPLVLLLLTLPVAGIYAVSAIDVSTRVEVRVRNGSGETLTDVRVSAGGDRASPGSLAPGKSRRVALRPVREGGIEISFIAAGRPRAETLDIYVCRDIGISAELPTIAELRARWEDRPTVVLRTPPARLIREERDRR